MKAFFTACMLLCVYQLSYASIKISSYNIRNFGRKGSYTDLKKLNTIIKNLNSDVIGVQEIVNTSKFKTFIESNFSKYKVAFSQCGGRGDQYLGIIYNSNKFKLIDLVEDDSVSDVSIDQEIEIQRCKGSLRPILIGKLQQIKTKEELMVMVVHLKAGGAYRSIARRSKQYKIISGVMNKYFSKGSKNIIALGDFNTTGYISKNRDYDNFQRLVSSTQTFDISEKVDCTSYWSGAEWDDDIEEPSVLDHILFSNNLVKKGITNIKVSAHCQQVSCKSVDISELGTSYKKVSDHCPISATIE